MQIIDGQSYFPKQFGSKDASGNDVLEEKAAQNLELQSIETRDDWNICHAWEGEIHCGTAQEKHAAEMVDDFKSCPIILMKDRAALFIFGIFVFMSNIYGEGAKLSPEVEILIAGFLGESRFRGNRDDPEQREKFMDLLTDIAEKSDERTLEWAGREEGFDIRAKVILIASDYRSRATVYEKIRRTYFARPQYEGNIGPMVTSPPEPEPSIIDNQYRLIFEGLLLAPPSNPEHDFAMDSAGTTIGRIGDVRSLSLFGFLFTNENRRVQVAVAKALFRMPSPEALATLLKGLSISLEQARLVPHADETQPLNIAPFFEIRKLFKWTRSGYMPNDKDANQKYEIWRNIILNYPTKDLDPQQKLILDELRALVAGQ